MNKQNIKIVSRFDSDKTIFEGEFENFSQCLQAAIDQKIDLYGADCRNQTITVTARDVVFRAVDFSGSVFNESEFNSSEFNWSKFNSSEFNSSEFNSSEFNESKFNSIGFVKCTGVDYSTIDLTPVRDDFWAVLCAAPKEVFALREALVAGKIDGSVYAGACACLVGTIANAAHCDYRRLDLLKPNSKRPAEQWFFGIDRSDTPETSEIARITLEWLDVFIAQMQSAFSERSAGNSIQGEAK